MSEIATVGEFVITDGPSLDRLNQVMDARRANVPLRDKTVVFRLTLSHTNQKVVARVIVTDIQPQSEDTANKCIVFLKGFNTGSSHGKIHAVYDTALREGILEILPHRPAGHKMVARQHD